MRRCAWCQGELSPSSRSDSIYCSKSHRQAAWRFGRVIQEATAAEQPLRLAYADPPYPGQARRYYQDHPDYQGEVDHAELLSRLQGYDGWALSTSSVALPSILALCVARGLQVRVAAWVRGARTHRSMEPVQSWEPVVYVSARRSLQEDATEDSLVHTSRARRTDPRHVVGAKPATFAGWMFALIGARRGDSLDDLFPGSGGIARAWSIFQASRPGRIDASDGAGGDASRGDGEDTSQEYSHDAFQEDLRDAS